MKEKTNFVSPFFGPFPSDRISKETKDANVQYISLLTVPLVQQTLHIVLYQRFREYLYSTTYLNVWAG